MNERQDLPAQPDAVRSQARKLLAEAGSPELAKHAVAKAAQDRASGGSPGDKFAMQWGFDSYLALFEASTPAATVGRKNWCVTAVSTGKWILWNDADLQAIEYTSREAAEQSIPPGDAPDVPPE